MPHAKLLEGYTRIPGRAERVKTPTGQIISDRAYKKISRLASNKTPTIGGQKVITNEALAKLNREIAPLEAAAKPARGRKSLRKIEPELRREFAQGRIEVEKQKVVQHKAEITARAVERKIKSARAKPTKLPRKLTISDFKSKRSDRSLNRAHDFPVSDLESIQEFWELAHKYKGSEFWGIMLRAINLKTGTIATPLLYGLADFSISPEDVIDEIEEREEQYLERGYLESLGYVLHVKLNESFYRAHNINNPESKTKSKNTKAKQKSKKLQPKKRKKR